MAQHNLRIYLGPDADEVDLAPLQQTVTTPLGNLLPLLAEALLTNQAWLDDFAEDSVTISSDLYEVLTTFGQLRNRPAA